MMGDRCHMTLQIGGTITSREHFDAVCKAIDDDWGQPSIYGEDWRSWPDKSTGGFLIFCATNNVEADFAFDEVNNADLECFKLIANEQLDLYAWNEAGGDYESRHQSYDAQRDRFFEWFSSQDGKVTMAQIDRILNDGSLSADEKMDALSSVIAKAKDDQWVNVREFEIEPTLLAELSKQPIVFRVDIPVWATAYIIAEDEDEARKKLATMSRESIDGEAGDIPVYGGDLRIPGAPEISVTSVMQVGEIDADTFDIEEFE